MINRLKIWSLMVLLGLNVSCEGFLDKVPNDAIPEDESMMNLTDAKQVVFGIYSSFKNPGLYCGGLTLLQDIQADVVYSVEGFTNTHGNIYNWNILSTDPSVEQVYAGLYYVISRCNFFFDNAPKVEATLKLKTDKEFFNKCKGDVYFARALAYSELIKVYCGDYNPATADTDLGVSIVLKYRNDPNTTMKRSSIKDSYGQVLEDLALASKLLPKSRNASDNIYFSPAAVSALYSRVYLYMHEWELAVKYATEVIDNKLFELGDATIAGGVHNGVVITEYHNMWLYDSSPEIIWKIALSTNDPGSSLGRVFLNYDNVSYKPDYVPASWLIRSYSNEDGRYYAFFEEAQTGYYHGLKWPLVVKYPGNPDIDAGGRPLFTNMPKVFRLSEQYLIRAEAYYNLGSAVNIDAACFDLTTLLRKRIMNYGTYKASGEEVLKTIQSERAKELFMEGFRLSDLKRWGMGFTRTPQASTNDGPNRLVINKENSLFTWPIPKHELDANPEIQPNPSNKK